MTVYVIEFEIKLLILCRHIVFDNIYFSSEVINNEN
jgi:hypothetical protein